MTRQQENTTLLIAGLATGTAVVGGLIALGVSIWPRKSAEPNLASDAWQTAPTYTEADVEAGARMLASENPRGSRALHIEQVFTQLRAAKPGQSLFDRITAGSGWGPQGERGQGGGLRPVSTTENATLAFRALVRQILDGRVRSLLPGARRFFEPAAQDRAFAIAERAREKQRRGDVLSKEEQRLLKYRRNAEQVRQKWLSEGARFVEQLDGIEFYT